MRTFFEALEGIQWWMLPVTLIVLAAALHWLCPDKEEES
jgi:hypothetical protein